MDTKIQKPEVRNLRNELEAVFPEKETHNYFRLPLTQGVFAVIDQIEKDRVLSVGGWCAQATDSGVYAVTTIAGRKIYLHDFVTGQLHTGFMNKLTLDCRLSNLFCEGRRGVMQNRRGKQNSSSKFKNVHLKNGEDKWRVALKCPDLGVINFGRYDCEEHAARIADAAALSIFGPHAFLNFPHEESRQHAALIERYIIKRRSRLAKKRIAEEIASKGL